MTTQTDPDGTANEAPAPDPARDSAAAAPAAESVPADPVVPRPTPYTRAFDRLTGSALAPYQSAVLRIGISFTWLCYLLREFPHRRALYGPDSAWSWGLARQLVDGNHAFTALLWSSSTAWFEIVYALAIASSLLLMLGWRTRAMSVLFMIGVLSLQNRGVFMGDGGDNVVHLMSIYLVAARCGRVWSLDARRAARGVTKDRIGPALWAVLGVALLAVTFDGDLSGGWFLILVGLWTAHGVWGAVVRVRPASQGRLVLDGVADLAHNAALLVITAEVCLIYSTAGWYKIQGSRWQDGTAPYYPLHLHYFAPWPAISALLSHNGALMMIIAYGTVAVQVAFPFALFNRRFKNVLLVVMMADHVGIAVSLGLPFFSLAMISADAVFLPTTFLLWAQGRGHGLVHARRRPATEAGRREDTGRAEGSAQPAVAPASSMP